MKIRNKIFDSRNTLNYLVIAIMAFMVAVVFLFIYSNHRLKDRVTIRVVEQTELISDLISRASINLMNNGHDGEAYENIIEYASLIGVSEIGIYGKDGKESFDNPDYGFADPGTTEGEIRRSLHDGNREQFNKVLSTSNMTGFFNHKETSYERYEPLLASGSCLKCHSNEGELLGVLKFSVSTKEDFAVLDTVQTFIWFLGIIITLPLIAVLVIGAIIKDKNKLLTQINESNKSLQSTYHDLDDTKRYLELILDNSKALIVTTDTRGNIVEFNMEAQQALEYTKEEVGGESVLMLYENPEIRTTLVNPDKSGIWATRNKEVKLRAKSGKVLDVSMSLSTLVNDRDEIIGSVGIGKDISEQKMLQFKLLQSEKLAGIGTLASGIAHEINNPLAGILGMAEAIKDEDDMELVKSYTDDIIKYSINASSIVRELSTYSRAARNEATSTMDVADVLKGSLKMAKHAAPLMSISVSEELEEGLYILANGGELQQVFVNLIVNAIHAMKQEGRLTLNCKREGNMAVVEIADTGHGIPAKYLSQIFDPFFTTKPAGSGTGLGLYVVYRIVTKYGGTIDVDSGPDKGTAFIMKFPTSKNNTDAAIII